jgi:hypothetical protein
MAGTPSERWWRAALGDLLATVGEAAVTGGLFVAQAFPYHAEGSHPVDKYPPPSFDFTKELVERAVQRGALLVVVNGKAGWRRALGAATVDSAVNVSSPLAGHLSRHNLGSAFDRVVDAIATGNSVQADRRPLIEGGVRTIVLERVERSREARRACLEHWGVACTACGMTFRSRYGLEGADGIQVHHLHPLAERRGEHEVDPVEDLRPVCPNCHVMIHTTSPPLPPEALADLLRSRTSTD